MVYFRCVATNDGKNRSSRLVLNTVYTRMKEGGKEGMNECMNQDLFHEKDVS